MSRQAIIVGRGAAGLLLLGPLLFALCGIRVLSVGTLDWLQTWGSALVFAGGALVCGARARVITEERSVWIWFTVACLCWTAANFYYALVVSPAPPPLPSPADIGYFSFVWAISLAILAYARRYAPSIPLNAFIDALIASLAIVAVGAAVMFAVVHSDTRSTGAVITTIIYPTEDVIAFGLFAGVVCIFSWRWNLRGALIATSILLICVGDGVNLGRVLGGSQVGGAWTNLSWTLGIALIAIVAWLPIGRAPRLRDQDHVQLVVPVLFSGVALAVLVTDDLLNLGGLAVVFAAGALVVAFVRLLHSLRESRALAESRRLALTDDLTGLPNRRRLLADLDCVCREGTRRLLALYDLDGFKHYNDTHGHIGGDHLLRALADRLRTSLPAGGTAYRLGGDEFCVLSEINGEATRWSQLGTEALRASGVGWTVTASVGTVELPREAGDASSALRIADQRMYAEKNRRPAAARQQARAVLLSALAEQQPTLRAHVHDVTEFVAEVAMALGMGPQEIDDVVRAAELHDIGKLAIPPEILDKPGPLDPDEWEIMRRHTVIGERMLKAAPALATVAPLVRASHERWDGDGYPDGLSGEDIPLGARIVSVCDSFDAMTAERPYRTGCSPQEAVAELRRCAGSQFDPAVVDAFLAALGVEAEPIDAV